MTVNEKNNVVVIVTEPKIVWGVGVEVCWGLGLG